MESSEGVSSGDASVATPKTLQTSSESHPLHELDLLLVQTIGRRGRSSHSESQLDYKAVASSPEGGDTRAKIDNTAKQRRTKSLFGARQNYQFGPKATLLQTLDTIERIQDPCKLMLLWDKKPQNVLVIKKIWDDKVDEAFVELVTWLIQVKKLDVLIEKKVMDDMCTNNQPVFSNIRSKLSSFKEGKDDLTGKVDLIVCLGGDGTLLYASTLFQASVPPVMAFHLGSLGFLSPFDFADYKERVTKVLEGSETCLMLRTRLKCDILRENGMSVSTSIKSIESQRHVRAINEVVVDRGDASYLCQLDLYIEDKQVTVVQGDGLIISTPTGSTAYAAAAGASMVHPNVPAIIIAPICPHSLSFRPIVVPAGVEIKVVVSPDARNDAWVSFDGRNRQQLHKTDVLAISTSKYPLPSVCNNDPIIDWFDGLAGCLHWNVRKIQVPMRNSSSFSSCSSTSEIMNHPESLESDGR